MPELPLMLKAALPSVPVVNQLPGVRKTRGEFTGLERSRTGVTIERAHVDRYAAVCGFPTKDTVPLPYPHLLAFELQMGIMTDPGFPAPAIGTVHLENSITQHRPIARRRDRRRRRHGRPVPHRTPRARSTTSSPS